MLVKCRSSRHEDDISKKILVEYQNVPNLKVQYRRFGQIFVFLLPD